MGGYPVGVPREGLHATYFFVHNVYANFFKDVLDYFGIHLYSRFEHQVVATYDKAVEYLQKKQQYGREIDKPQLPALILNPSGDFEWADANTTGHQLWRFPNLMPGFIKRVFDPIYSDANTQVHVGFSRIKGTMEILMLLNSFYEYCDLRMLLLLIFGGMDRWIYPQYFTSFIILPDEFINYVYTNEYTGLTYKLDWESAGAYQQLVKTTARNELVVPVNIKPIFKLASLADNSERYGGIDKLADWKLTATIEYELEVPSFLVLESDYLVQQVDIEIRSGSGYYLTEAEVPNSRTISHADYHWGNIDETSNSFISTDSTCSVTFEGDLVFKTRYYHLVTQEEQESEIDVVIDLPETIENYKYLLVKMLNSFLDYGDHYILINGGTQISIRHDTIGLVAGTMMELFVYGEEG